MSEIVHGKYVVLQIFNGRKRPNIAIADKTYFLPTESLIQSTIYPMYRNWLTTMKLGKWYHKWDCDNFAEAFKVYANGYYFSNIDSNAESIAVGMIHYEANARAEGGGRGAHAANFFLTKSDGRVVLKGFEPQNGAVFNLTPEEFNSITLFYL